MSQFTAVTFHAVFEAEDYIRGMSQIAGLNDKAAKGLLEFTKATQILNDKGKEVGRSLTAVDEAGNTVTNTWKKVGKEFKLVASGINTAAAALDKIKEKAFAAGQATADLIRTQTKLSDKKDLLSLDQALGQLQAKVGKYKIEASRVVEIFNQLQTGTAKGLTSKERDVANTLSKVIAIQENANQRIAAAQKKNDEQLFRDWRRQEREKAQLLEKMRKEQYRRDLELFREFIRQKRKIELENERLLRTKKQIDAFQGAGGTITQIKSMLPTLGTGADPAAIAKFNTSLLQLQETVGKFGINARRVVQIYENLRKGVISAVTPAEAQVVKSLTRMMAAHEAAEKSIKSFTNGILLSWQSIGRLASIQILHRIVSELIQLFSVGRTEAIKFFNQVSLIKTITLDVASSNKEWAESIRKISDLYGTDLNDTALAFYEAISNQITKTTQQTEQFVGTVLNLARVTQSTARDAGAVVAGVLNAYQLSAAQAERVSAVLFKAVDLGSFTLNDVADRLGRVSPLANEIGIQFEEVAGALSALTIEGRRADASLTILRALIQKFNKPTEEMVALFKDYNVQTGQSLITTVGFENVIKRFSQIVERDGTAAIVKYFDELRSLEAGTSLTTTAFQRLGEFIKEIKEQSLDDFLRAIQEIVNPDPIRKLQIEFNKIKNIFTVDLAGGFLQTIARLNESLDGFGARLRTIFNTLGSTVTGTILKGLTQLAELLAKMAGGSGLDTLTRAVVALAEAFALVLFYNKLLIPALALLRNGFSLTFPVITFATTLLLQFNDAIRQGIELAKQNYLDSIASSVKAAVERIKRSFQQIDKDFQETLKNTKIQVLNYLTERAEIANREKALLQDDAREIEAFIDSSLRNRLDRFKDYVNALNREISNLQKKIINNQKEIKDVFAGKAERNFDLAQQFRTEAEQYIALIAKIKQLGGELGRAGSVEEAKRIFEQALDFVDKAAKVQEQRQSKAQEKGKLTTVASALTAQTELSKLRNQLEDVYISKLNQENELLEKQKIKIEQQAAADAQIFGELKATIKEALKVKLFDAEGKLTDPQAAIQRINTVISRMDELVAKSPDIIGFGQFEQLLKLREDLAKDVDELGNKINLKEQVNKVISEIGARFAKSQTLPPEVLESLKKLGIVSDDLNQVRVAAENLFTDLQRDLSNALADEQKVREQRVKDITEIEAIRTQLLKVVDNLKIPENIGVNKALFTKLIESLNQVNNTNIIEELQKNLPKGMFGFNDADLNIFKEAIKSLSEIESRRAEFDKAIQNAEELKKSVTDFSNIAKELISPTVKQTAAIEANTAAIDRLIGALMNTPKFASGGATDSQLARITPGEFIVNPQASKTFSPLLHAINDFKGIGRSVTNNLSMGGINISVAGEKNPQLTAKSIVDEINRGVNAGIYKLSRGRV